MAVLKLFAGNSISIYICDISWQNSAICDFQITYKSIACLNAKYFRAIPWECIEVQCKLLKYKGQSCIVKSYPLVHGNFGGRPFIVNGDTCCKVITYYNACVHLYWTVLLAKKDIPSSLLHWWKFSKNFLFPFFMFYSSFFTGFTFG